MNLGSIQILRAIAAILIVYAHSIDLTQTLGEINTIYNLSEIGFIGQDLFFIISGFILSYRYSNYRGFDMAIIFLQKRLFRINPLYYISSIFYILCHTWHIWSTSHMLPIPFTLMSTSLADTILVVPTTANFDGYNPLLSIGWVLAFGWLFSILFAILILTNVKHKSRMLLMIIVSMSTIGYVLKPSDLRLSFLTNPILLEFMFGCILCHIYIRYQKIPRFLPIALAVTGTGWLISLIFGGYGYITVDHAILDGSLSLQRVLLWGVPGTLIIASCIFMEKQGRAVHLWNNKVAILVGNASFSIYLMHLPVFSLIALLYQQMDLEIPPDASIAVQVITSVVLSVMLYKLIEKPLTSWLNKFILKDQQKEPLATPSSI